jgi:hypothetical protein
VFMFRGQNVRQNYNIKRAVNCFEILAKLKCLGTTEADQNCSHEEISYWILGMPATI